MNMLTRWIEDAQAINVEEKGVSYSEEAFTQLYDEALRLKADHKIELNIATGKGMLIGATSMGLVGLGIYGINKFRKRKLKDGEKEVAVTLGEIKTLESEVGDIDDRIKSIRKVSNKNREALESIISEISNNDKGVKH